MENEFSRIDMTCTAESLIPRGPEYNDVNHQVCTLPGSRPGTYQVSGSDYIRQGFSYDPSELWRNFGIILALIIFFLIMNVVLGELINFAGGGMSFKTFTKPNPERKELNETLQRKREERRAVRGSGRGR